MPRPLAALAAIALVLAACSGPTTADRSTNESPTAYPGSPAPTPSPREADATSLPSPSAPELALGADVIAEVVTTDLVMRTAPGVFDESLMYPGRLGPSDRLYLVDGPVAADGFDWYLADPFQIDVQEGEEWVRFGWVAAADKTGEDWIVPVAPECPPEPDLQTLNGLLPQLQLACFGDRTIQLEGDVSCENLGPPIPTAMPAWFTWERCNLNPQGFPYDPMDHTTSLGIPIHYPPDAERTTGYLRITGHFDDPRATECRMPMPFPSDDVFGQELAHQARQLGCRASLVVDEAVPADGS